MSKKLIYIKIIIVTICLLFVCMFIFLFSNIQQSVKVDNAIEETTVEDKIMFDLKKTPQQQKKEIYAHPKEYLKELYDYTFGDERFSNCFGYDFFSAHHIVNDFKSTESLQYYLVNSVYRQLFYKLFKDSKEFELIELTSLPVTDKYIECHPNSLKEEFDFIKKEDYKHPKIYHSEYFDYWYKFGYDYSIWVDEEKKEVCVVEGKYAVKVFVEDGIQKSGIVRDKDGNEVNPDVVTRNIYFKYTTDEKGYVDDIVYDRTEIITDDKYLDNLIKYE